MTVTELHQRAMEAAERALVARRSGRETEAAGLFREAFEAARGAFQRMNGKGPAKAILDDKKVQRDLQQAAESLKEASDQLRGKRRSGGFGLGKALLVAIIGAALILILSEDARRALLDRLFGAEEEFEYTSTTTPDGSKESVPS